MCEVGGGGGGGAEAGSFQGCPQSAQNFAATESLCRIVINCTVLGDLAGVEPPV